MRKGFPMTRRDKPRQPPGEASPKTIECRHPSRIGNPSPELIGLMRLVSALEGATGAASDDPDRSIDNRDTARDILMGMTLGLLLWVVLVGGVWLFRLAS